MFERQFTIKDHEQLKRNEEEIETLSYHFIRLPSFCVQLFNCCYGMKLNIELKTVAFVMGIDVIPQLRTNLVFFSNIQSFDDITNCTRHSLSSVSHIFSFYITIKLENFKIIRFLIEFHYNLPN